MKVILNEDPIVVEQITTLLNRNKEKYGQRYCPCSIKRDKDTICRCKAFRDQVEKGIEGNCHCGLWKAINDDK